MARTVLRVLPWCLVLLGCPSPSGPDSSFVCDAVGSDSCVNPAARFEDLKPTLQTHCSPCHTGARDAPWPFETYSNIADWSDLVRADLVTCSMPPSDAGTRMTKEERAQILDWLRCGLPQ